MIACERETQANPRVFGKAAKREGIVADSF
jgi:hypothetical protein